MRSQAIRTALYTRVSTDEQAEHGYSLQSQLEQCRRYAELHELSVTVELSDDRSGSHWIAPVWTDCAT